MTEHSSYLSSQPDQPRLDQARECRRKRPAPSSPRNNPGPKRHRSSNSKGLPRQLSANAFMEHNAIQRARSRDGVTSKELEVLNSTAAVSSSHPAASTKATPAHLKHTIKNSLQPIKASRSVSNRMRRDGRHVHELGAGEANPKAAGTIEKIFERAVNSSGHDLRSKHRKQ